MDIVEYRKFPPWAMTCRTAGAEVTCTGKLKDRVAVSEDVWKV